MTDNACKLYVQNDNYVHLLSGENFELMTREVVSVLISTNKKFMEVSDVQVVCCGTISYLSSSSKEQLVLI